MRSRITVGLTSLLCGVHVLFGASPQEGRLSATVLTEEHGPVNGLRPAAETRGLVSSLCLLTYRTYVPLGVEVILDSTPPKAVSPSRPTPLVGRTVGQSLTLLTGELPDYTWHDDGRIIHVMPRTGAQGGFLDQAVPLFELKDQTLLAAFVAVQRLFDKDFPEMKAPPVSGPGLAEALQRSIDDAMARKLSLSIKGGTVRGVLDAIVLAHGGASWIASYASPDRRYEHSQLGFALFAGRRLMLPAGYRGR